MNASIVSITERLKSPRIFLMGDLILDRYILGSVQRVSPEAPVQVLNMEREEFRPGGAANVAANLSALGARVQCAGVVGCDVEGEEIRRLVKSWTGSASRVIRDGGKPTSVKTRMIAQNQQMLRVDHEDPAPISARVRDTLLRTALHAAAHADLAILSDYSKGTLPPALCTAFIRKARCPVLVGLKSSDHAKYRGATGASLNRMEVLALGHGDSIDASARRVLKELALEFLVVTLSEKGVRVYSRSQPPFTLPALAREVYDVSGAGDTALAAFAIGYASGIGLADCAALSTAASGIVVAKSGTATVTRDELREGYSDSHRKILPLRVLLHDVARARAQRKRIVFTNGCFDLFHAGHVSVLEFAKAQGDLLVVGVNSDKSVRCLKGPGRPIVPLDQRAQLLAACAAVDFVVSFDDPTPTALIRQLRPDVLVKGEDYKGRGVAGQGYAGRVELAPFVRGLSSSEMIRRIRQGEQ